MTKYLIKERWVGLSSVYRYVFHAYEVSLWGLVQKEVANTYAWTRDDCLEKLHIEINRRKKMQKHKLLKETVEIE